MTAYVIVSLTALLASGLTFFTGFGLGTLLMPTFAVFFPPSVAVALTAVVHFLNGLFKIVLVGKHVHWRTVMRFGLPAMAAAFVGARVLIWLDDLKPIVTFSVAGASLSVAPVKAVIAAVMIFFAIAELSKRVVEAKIDPKWMPLGGIISGFFGGLSGHQGAFRSAFLVRVGLEPKAFVATGAMIALVIDVARLVTYTSGDILTHARTNLPLVAAATAAAFTGAFLGNRYLHKVTVRGLRLAVAGLLIVLAICLLLGLI